jgi:nucleoside-diphosphate-sugar epimerase
LPVTVFRIDVVFDDDDHLDISTETIRAALRGDPIKVERGEAGAAVHVDDVARAFLMATLNRKSYGQIFNLSCPEAYMTDLEVCQLVVDTLDSKSRIDLVETDLTGPVLGAVDKAESVLGWKPLKGRKDLEKTIVRMAQREVR